MSNNPDLSVIAKIVNLYGDGKHAIATAGTLPFFSTAYVERCIRRALDSGRLSYPDMEEVKCWLDPKRVRVARPKPKTLVHFF